MKLKNFFYTKFPYIIILIVIMCFSTKFVHAYQAPSIPSVHPRIYITPEILSSIMIKVATGGPMYSVYQNIKSNADLYVDDPSNMPSWMKKGAMETFAFLYLIEGDTVYSNAAKQLVNDLINNYPGYTSSQLFNSLGAGHQRPIAIVYDWIYDTLSQAERKSLTDHMIVVSENTVGFMPINTQKNLGNNPTIQGLNNLYATIAIYGDGYRDNEALTLLNDFGEFFEGNTIPQMNKMWGTNGGEVSGRSYSKHNFITRLPYLIEMWRVLTNGSRNYFTTANFMKYFSYWDAMSWRPDNYHMKNGAYTFYEASKSDYFRYVYSLLANRLNDPLSQYIAENTTTTTWQNDWQYILWYDPSVSSNTYQSYPKDALFDGTGTIVSRTGWDIGSYSTPSDDTYVTFQSGPWWFYHQNYDQNTFTVYHKGGLITDGGKGLDTNLRNTILIDNENQIINSDSNYYGDKLNRWRDFGSGTKSEIAKVKRYETATNYLYALGDASKAYNSSKLSLFHREFVFLKPNYLVVFDRVNTTSLTYSKKYLLNSISVPKIDNTTPPDGTSTYNGSLIQIDRGGTISNGYPSLNGRLFSKTLLPANSQITIVGSGQSSDLTNKKEAANWRIEIEAANPQLNDNFLHVMQVGTSDTMSSMSPTIRIDADTMVGTLINDVSTPQIVLFSSDTQGADVTSVTYQANYASSLTGEHILLDMSPGTYDVYKNGIKIQSNINASYQGVLSFNSSGGSLFQVVQTGVAPTQDTTPPTIPNNLIAATMSSSQINLSWNASTDDVGISGYKIYRDGTQITTTTNTTYSDTGLPSSTTYTYMVSAYDATGNESAQSYQATATTSSGSESDTTPPTITTVNTGGVSTQIVVVFSEPVEQASTENTANYNINSGIIVSGASLGSDLKTVTLTTSSHTDGDSYTLTVNNIKDRASVPNMIAANSQMTYTFIVQLVNSNITVTSGQTYEIVHNGLQDGALVYVDRTYTYSGVPISVKGATYIKTANDDKLSGDSSFITFDVSQDVSVYVAHDDRIIVKPSWMTSFTDTGDDLVIASQAHSIWKKNFTAGTITLGGNAGGSNSSMYSIKIVEQGTGSTPDITPPSPPTGLFFTP